ncbi:MAG: HEAT repeat domain-containing protein [Pseudanabaenaceae cyanobacterium SKYGB_i_bin29]|nr:HEAT repeat domain-containing protein [Pseudanabaenaceae cyanobacterium SKYG29]MDW8421102.1 HEAT repeat domain-containing protein [Pseudanabaenaceae cyanobacterium SKYGB_i_bin29]
MDELDCQNEYPELPPPPDPEEMLPLLCSAVPLERMTAARAFCELEDARAIPHLIRLLQDECPLVRVSAAYALGRNPDRSAVPPLIQQLEDWNGYVRKGVVWALGNSRDPRALEPLIWSLQNDITAVRLWAASALGQLGLGEAVPHLIAAYRREEVAVIRSNCVWALGKLLPHYEDREEGVELLVDALQDEDLGVQSDASIALRRIGDEWGLQMLGSFEYERGYCDLVYP